MTEQPGEWLHGHPASEPCNLNCPVGGADGAVRIHLFPDGCNHRYGNVCPACAGLTDEEAAAVREYFRLLESRKSTGAVGGSGD